MERLSVNDYIFFQSEFSINQPQIYAFLSPHPNYNFKIKKIQTREYVRIREFRHTAITGPSLPEIRGYKICKTICKFAKKVAVHVTFGL